MVMVIKAYLIMVIKAYLIIVWKHQGVKVC